MDCEWNEWGDWKRGKCRCINEPGKPGKKYRSRDRKIGEDFGGKPCLKLNKKPMPIGKIKTFTENWDSKAPSVGTLLAYLETTA